jgi:2,5-furandicarboxylate decarboxylase 1
MGLDATRPLSAGEMKFKRIRVPGEEQVDMEQAVSPLGASHWRKALGR